MKKSKIRKIGNSYGVVLPKAMLDRLKVKEGDAVYLVERTDGVELKAVDPEFGERAEALRDGLRRYRNAMTELAKR